MKVIKGIIKQMKLKFSMDANMQVPFCLVLSADSWHKFSFTSSSNGASKIEVGLGWSRLVMKI